MTRKSYVCALLACLLLVGTSTAQHIETRPCPCKLQAWAFEATGVSSAFILDSTTPPFKSPSGALSRSLLGTLIPLPTIVFTVPGIILGPSLGYFYAGRPGRAWLGIGIRVIGIGGMASSFAICGWDCGPGSNSYDIGMLVFLSGAGLAVGSAIYDIATVKSATMKHNQQVGAQALASVGPWYSQNTRTWGLGVRIKI